MPYSNEYRMCCHIELQLEKIVQVFEDLSAAAPGDIVKAKEQMMGLP